MSEIIQIIDYGMGNILSVVRGFSSMGADVKIVKSANEIDMSKKLILPGVGSFKDGISNLKERGLFELIIDYHNSSSSYLLGICLGMQMLATYGEANGGSEGLDIIPGRVTLLEVHKDFPIPHVGWNSVNQVKKDNLYNEIPSFGDFYFVHSYQFVLNNQDNRIGTTQYGNEFNSIVRMNKTYGVQFHPEKSQKFGLQLLKNFVRL